MSAEEFGAGYGRILAAGMLFLLLAACAGIPPAGQHLASRQNDPQTQAGSRAPAATSRMAKAFEPAGKRVVPAAAKLATESMPLVGMNVIQVVRVLGRPIRLRRDPPAEVWQYANPRCVLFLFFYQGRGSKEWRVQYVESRDRQTVELVAAGDCLKAQLDRSGASSDAW